MTDSVTCVVVTRDRLDLLRSCLAAIGAQTRPPDRVIVVDNASTDGTPDAVRREFPGATLLALPENTGGAGGFHAGIEAAHRAGADWIWVLDDDTVARADALEQLLGAPWAGVSSEPPALLASRVDWTDGSPHPMNTPILRRRDTEAMVRSAACGILPLRATTFVSLLIRSAAVDRHGLPRAEYFLQADDIEFTARVLRSGCGYLVPQSVVEHRTAAAHTFMDDPSKFHFHLRNTLFMLRSPAWSAAEKAALGWLVLDSSVRFVSAHRSGESMRTVARAVRDGLRGPASRPGAGARGSPPR